MTYLSPCLPGASPLSVRRPGCAHSDSTSLLPPKRPQGEWTESALSNGLRSGRRWHEFLEIAFRQVVPYYAFGREQAVSDVAHPLVGAELVTWRGRVALEMQVRISPRHKSLRKAKEQSMAFFCPACGTQLAGNYNIARVISTVDHGRPTNCPGIGTRKGAHGHEPNKKQEQIKARQAAESKNAQHKEQKSMVNLQKYQTAHKNPTIQDARVEMAKTEGLKGHSSANSGFKKNSGTTTALNNINQQTSK